MELNFKVEKETPGTFRFYETDDEGNRQDKDDYVIGTLYIRKEIFKGKTPKGVKINLEIK